MEVGISFYLISCKQKGGGSLFTGGFHLVNEVIGSFMSRQSDGFDSHLRVDAGVKEEGGKMSGGMDFIVV